MRFEVSVIIKMTRWIKSKINIIKIIIMLVKIMIERETKIKMGLFLSPVLKLTSLITFKELAQLKKKNKENSV